MKFISKTRIEFTIDGKSVYSHQLCFLGPKGFEIYKATPEIYSRNLDFKPEYVIFFDKYGKVAEIQTKNK